MSLFTSKMKLLAAVVLDKKSEEIAAELLKLGLLDFIEFSRLIDSDEIKLKTISDKDSSVISGLKKNLEAIYQQAGVDAPYGETLSMDMMTSLNLSKESDFIDKIKNELQTIRERQKNLHQEKLKMQEISEYFSDSGRRGKNPLEKFLIIHKGQPKRGSFSEMLNKFASIPHFGMKAEDSDSFYLVALRRDEPVLNEIFDKYSWEENDEQQLEQNEKNILQKSIHSKTEDIEKEIEDIRADIKAKLFENKTEIDKLWKNLKIHELYDSIKDNFSHTDQTCMFSGWLPAAKADKVEKVIRKVTDNECIIEWQEAENFKRESIPVEMKHSKAMAPFQMLVENYAVPEYGTIDPTIFVAISYMIMFGLMFGDAGQGLVIMLIGIIGKRLMKKPSDGVKKLMRLFVYCGTASIITGILFGSYFGYSLFPPLWFDYHGIVSGHHGTAMGSIRSIYDILAITIYFGITIISIGLAINWINLYKKRHIFKLLLDKSGLLGGWFYGCGIYTAFYFVKTGYKELPESNLLFIFFGIPVIILAIKSPLHFFLYERKNKKFTAYTLIDFIMELIVELLEIFSGYLSNTLSFMRVAGLGIGHVSLMAAFGTIAGLTSSGIASIIIIILGNALVIALEGLSAGIQALRLNYYEFFSRYFTGKGIAYNPVSLRNRKQEG